LPGVDKELVTGLRGFMVISNSAVTSQCFSLDDLPGSSGRLDVVCRSITNALLVSHGVRRDTMFYALLRGEPQPPVCLRIVGAKVSGLNPDERSVAGMLRSALGKVGMIQTVHLELEAHPGFFVSRRDLDQILFDMRKNGFSPMVVEEGGVDIGDFHLPKNPFFILGDQDGIVDRDMRKFETLGFPRVSLGPVAIHTDQCVTILHNWMDRRGVTSG